MATTAAVDTVVVGAGVIGLAVARALSVSNVSSELLLLDRAAQIGSETSSRNSEVLHAGIYYPANSLKAQWCVHGKNMLYEYCRDKSVPNRRVGKLVVATAEEQVETLRKLRQQAEQNGVETHLLSKDETLSREPSLSPSVAGALYSPSTGIVDSHSFMVQLLADAEDDGTTTLSLHTEVKDAEITKHSKCIRLFVDGMWLCCRNVVNCTGLWAHGMARLLHRNTEWQPPQQYFAKGTYFRTSSASPKFSHLIYPVPDPRGGLGTHATLDLQGQVKFGPDVEWLAVDQTDPDEIDLQPDPARAQSFYESIRSYWPGIASAELVPDYCGIRPKLQHPSLMPGKDVTQKMPFQDFLVVGSEMHGVPGLIHLFGMESPGLTSSMAIAEHVVNRIRNENS